MAWILSGDPRLGPLAGGPTALPTGPLAGGYGSGGWSPDFSEADPSAVNLNPDPMRADYLGALRQALPQAAARYRASQWQPGVPQPGLIHDVGYGYGGPVGGAVADMLQAPRTGPEAAMMFGLPAVGAIKAYHGSPHDFERFDMSKIGTGEGAQVYGHGLYFAENPQTAASYRLSVSGQKGQGSTIEGKPIDYTDPVQSAAAWVHGKGSRQAALDFLKNDDRPEVQAIVDVLKSDKPIPKLDLPGKQYEVSINADPEHFLDWDKPLSEQPKAVQEKLKPFADEAAYQLGKDASSLTVADMLPVLGNRRASSFGQAGRAQGAAKVSADLRAAGIKGIRYKDQGSRGAEGGTYNYAVFDDKIIDILKKYGIAGLTTGGAIAGALSGGQQQRPGT